MGFLSPERIYMRISFAVLNEDATIPNQDGFVIELFSAKGITIQPSEIMKVGIGLSVEIEKGFAFHLTACSVLHDKGLSIYPGTLVVYSGHADELFIPLQNGGRQQVNILPGDLLAHGVVTKLEDIQLTQVDPKLVVRPKNVPRKTKPQKNPDVKFEIK